MALSSPAEEDLQVVEDPTHNRYRVGSYPKQDRRKTSSSEKFLIPDGSVVVRPHLDCCVWPWLPFPGQGGCGETGRAQWGCHVFRGLQCVPPESWRELGLLRLGRGV